MCTFVTLCFALVELCSMMVLKYMYWGVRGGVKLLASLFNKYKICLILSQNTCKKLLLNWRKVNIIIAFEIIYLTLHAFTCCFKKVKVNHASDLAGIIAGCHGREIWRIWSTDLMSVLIWTFSLSSKFWLQQRMYKDFQFITVYYIYC